MLNEKKLCSLLKATFSRGYDIIPRSDTLTLNGHNWALVCGIESVPKKAALQIVENVGYMPTIPMSVQRGCSNQMMMEVLQFEEEYVACNISANNTVGIWTSAGHRLLIAPARFKPEDKQKLLHIATYDWANQRSNLTVVNMSLFQDDEDIEPDIIEE